MTRSELIDRIAERAPHVPRREVEAIVHAIFERMTQALVAGERIELRGFGCFTVRERRARVGRNPKTGQRVEVPIRRILSFATGKELRARLNRPRPAEVAPPLASVPPVTAPALPPPPTGSVFVSPPQVR